MRLTADKVIEAREKEMRYVRDMRVWEKIPRIMAQAKGWKVIKTRWIDINKGDDENPVYRSRLVGRNSTTKSWTAYLPGPHHWKP